MTDDTTAETLREPSWMTDDIGRMPLPADGPDYWADLQAWALAALRKTQAQADRIAELLNLIGDDQ